MRLAQWKHRGVLLLVAVLLATLVMRLGSADISRSNTLELGSPGDTPFLTGFFADEPDIDYRYRWSKGHSDISFHGLGSARPREISIRVQGPRLDNPSTPITLAVALNGRNITPEPVELAEEISLYYFDLLSPELVGVAFEPPYVLTLDSSTFAAPDGRTLGAKIDYVTVRQTTEGLNLPPLDVVLWSLLYAAGLVALVARLRWDAAVWLAMLGLFLGGIAFVADPLYASVYLPPVASVVAIVGVLVWQKERIGRGLTVLAGLRGRLPTEERGEERPARLAMLAAMILFAGLALWAIPQVAWIGHADYAENANVARNLIEGRGLTVDYTAQFYQERTGITHPADTWPLLQPMMIAPFFAMFGPQTWAAKLPNLFILLALSWGVFRAGSRLWNLRVGLLAGLFTLLHSYFFNAVLYPINDLGFTAIFFALAYMVGLQITGTEAHTAGSNNAAPLAERFPALLGIGVLAGLLIWSKPSGAVLLAGLVMLVGVTWWRRTSAEGEHSLHGRLRLVPWRPLLLIGGVVALVVLPLLVRNLLAFGAPFYSTESLDVWILRYWDFYKWENIYKYYVGSELPHPRWIVGGKFGYENLFNAIGTNFLWVWEKGVMGGIRSSEFVIGPYALLGALLGLVVAPRRVVHIVCMALGSIALYVLFVLIYWHFEGRYLQVAIPWLYLLLAGAVVRISHLIASLVKGAARSVLATAVTAVLAASLLWPHLQMLGDYLRFDTRPTSFTVAMEWLRDNSTPEDVVMTRDPWELNWHSERRAVMIPYDDLATIRDVADRYGVTMLQLGGPTDGINVAQCPSDADAAHFPVGQRPALGKLYCGFELPGFSRVYQNGDLTIYRLSPLR